MKLVFGLSSLTLVLFSVVMGAFGQFLLKLGANRLSFNVGSLMDTAIGLIKQMIVNPLILGGFLLFAMSSFIWIIAVSGLELSLAYPMVSLGYTLVVFLSWIFLGESLSWLRVSGVMVICMGVFMVSRS